MAGQRLDRGTNSPNTITPLQDFGALDAADRWQKPAPHARLRGGRSWSPWKLGVCVAVLLACCPMRGAAQTQAFVPGGGTGTFPDGVAVNTATNKIYIANQGSGNVTVVDGATNSAATIATGKTPHGIAVNSVTNRIYVTNEGSASVTVIDGADGTTSSVAIGKGPYSIALNSATNKIYVTNEGSDTVTVIDGATNAATTLFTERLPGAVAVNSQTNKIYVVNKCGLDPTCAGAGSVTVIDGATNSTISVPAGIGSGAVAVNPVTNQVYVANSTSNTVTVIDGATNAATAVAIAEPGAMAVNPVTNQVYVASGGNSLAVIDGATRTLTTLVVATKPAAITVNPVTNQIYLLHPSSRSVSILEGATNHLTTVAAAGAPVAGAVNPVTNQIFLATISSTNVTRIDGFTSAMTMVAVNPLANPVPLSTQGLADTLENSGADADSSDTAIAAVASPSSSTPNFTFSAATISSGLPPEAESVFFQVDSLQGPWIAATRSGATFTGTVPSALSAGAHIVYAYTSDSQDAASTGAPDGVVGHIAAQVFTSVIPDVITPGLMTSLVPDSAVAGSPAFTMTVNGSGFVVNVPNGLGTSSSVIEWNGSVRNTTYVSATELTVQVLASDIQTPGTATVSLILLTTIMLNGVPTTNATAQPDTTTGTTSLPFTITSTANPVPTLTSISPTSATAGGAAFTLTVTGTNFVSNSVVQWNGAALTTTFGSATQLTAMVPASDITSSGTASVTVFNPTPGGGTSGAQTFTINAAANNPVPTLTSISPTSATAGDAAFTLTVTGTNFISASVVKWNGAALTTTFGSATQLTAMVPASDIVSSGTASVTVFNPTPGGGTSGAQTFTINAAANNPVPTLTMISPTSATAGGATFTLTATGTGFVSGSVVKWNGAALTTTFGGATQLTAMVPASDITSSGTASVTVFSPTPGGGTSGAQTFTINVANNPAPTLTTISPTSATAGGAAFTLTATGTGFVSGSVVKWNGTALTTTFGSATQLTAMVPASDIATSGTASVTVFSSTPGGGTSGAQTFTINAPQNNPAPTLTVISPTSASAGGAALTLTVTGTGYVSASVVKWNGTALTTTFVSATQLTAAVPASDIASSGTPSVTVFNPTPGGGTSTAIMFSITDFTMSDMTSTQTVTAGQSAMFTIGTGTAGGAFTGTVSFAATGLPAGTTAMFAPTSVAPGMSTMLTVTTTARSTSATPWKPFGPLGNGPLETIPVWLAALALGMWWMGASGGAGRSRRKLRLAPVAAILLLVVAAGYLAGCSSSRKIVTPTGTPAGTYNITVTGTYGTNMHTATATMIVQ